MPASQAGRRGFESLLPLHHFNNLRSLGLLQKPTFRGKAVRGRAEPIERTRLERLTSIVPGWLHCVESLFPVKVTLTTDPEPWGDRSGKPHGVNLIAHQNVF